MIMLLRRCHRLLAGVVADLRHRRDGFLRARPAAAHATVTGTDLLRSRAQLLAENALLRQQVIVLRRNVARPAVTAADRALLVLLAGRVRAWRQALLIVRPEALLRWHRAGFRSCWKRRPRPGPGRPPLPAATPGARPPAAPGGHRRLDPADGGGQPALGRRAAPRRAREAGPARGQADRPNVPGAAAPRPRGQTWATFLRNHVHEIWACDFLPVTDRRFRPLFACFIIALATRRVVHVGTTRHPTDVWVAPQLREATPFDQRPRYRIRDNDGKFGLAFTRVAAASGLTILRTPYRAPRANAVCERFLGSIRRECLDHLLVLGERHRARVLREYAAYFNREGRIKALVKRHPCHPRSHFSAAPGRYVAFRSWAVCTMPTTELRSGGGRICSQRSSVKSCV